MIHQLGTLLGPDERYITLSPTGRCLLPPGPPATTTAAGPDPDDPWAEWTWVLRVPEQSGVVQPPEVA